jgi:hypothetical protein
MQSNRALILRGNRFLGSALVDKGLLSTEQLEAANDRFMELVQQDGVEQVSLLTILLHEQKAIVENTLLVYYGSQLKMGLIDPTHLAELSARDLGYDLSLARATLTIPFDRQDGFVSLASAYFLSAPVVKAWESVYSERLIWYAAPVRGIFHYLERVEELETALAEAEAEMEAEVSTAEQKNPV